MSDMQELSLRLNDVLEMVGVTEEMRSYHRRRATMRDILSKTYIRRHYGKLWNVNMCGSSWEGSVTPDLVSDLDIIVCRGEPLVVPHHRMAGPGMFLRVVREEWTRPGYVKLQWMTDGRPLTVNDVEESIKMGFDGDGRACHKHISFGTKHGQTRHGPATMYVDENGRHISDRVLALQCKDIPLFATDWIMRHRRYDWPSQHLIDELKMMGCLFVSVGHFESRDRELEWRFSFSLQERVLMKNLNITQHRVYVVLKLIRKDIVDKCLKEESLSSYHCKTCVLYMAETTPASMWVPENMISCLLQCLALLLQWIKDRFCPNFFIKESNLFDKESFPRVVDRLEPLITELLQMGHRFLYRLQSDRVGEMLRGGDLVLYKPVADSSINKNIFFLCDFSAIYHSVVAFRCVPYNTAQDSLTFYMTELEELKHVDCIPGNTEEEYKYALRHASPWLHLSIGLEFAARAVTCPDTHEGKELMNKVECHLQQAKNTDLMNVKLAQATILLRLEKLEECFILLQELENCCTNRVTTVCPCIGLYQGEQQECEMAAECRNMSLKQIMKTHLVSCVIFERSQMELVPHPLRYEMYRSLYTRPGSRHEFKDTWFDRAVVGANVYMHLLQYVVCSKLNREPHKQIAIDNLASITLRGGYKWLSHMETAFNLLGWIYQQENRVADAVWCFLQSWQIRPHHNAAKFHVLVMIYRLIEPEVRARQ